MLLTLWRKKWLIAIGATLPALAFGLLIFFSPRSYQAELSYPMTLTALSLQKLNGRFYSGENMARIRSHMDDQNFNNLLKVLSAAEGEDDYRKVLNLRSTPDYIEFSKRANLKLSLERSWAENIQKLEQLTAQMLTIHIKGAPQEEMVELIQIMRQNFEKEMPMYEVHDHLSGEIYNLNLDLAAIEKNRHQLKLTLERDQETLARMKKIIASSGSRNSSYDINITFENINEEDRFLPLGLQVQAYESEVARVIEKMADAERRYDLQMRWRTIANQIYSEVGDNLGKPYGIDDYLEYLNQKMNSLESPEEGDLLKAHIIAITNLGLTRRPLTRDPGVQPLARGTVFKTAVAFAFMLMVMVLFVTFLEYIRTITEKSADS